jgi:uncharacterized protein with HEPN domain
MKEEEIYPEHERLSRIKDKSQIIGEFIEWLGEAKGYHIGQYREYQDDPFFKEMIPIRTSTEKLLAEFFGIDLNKIEKEKLQMLDEIRNLNKQKAVQ